MGIAYLDDGRMMQYEEYLKTPEWKNKKANRLAFDNWRCGICHAPLSGDSQTHHLNYSRLGHEDVEHDLISICNSCHTLFHNRWERVERWSTNQYSHWKDYSLEHTAKFCSENLANDYFFGGKLNMCSRDTIYDRLNEYFKSIGGPLNIRIDEEDIICFFRNKRYEIWIAADKNGETLDELLNSMFGEKGSKASGGNKLRSEARSFLKKHPLASIKRIYKESETILTLMKAVNDMKG